MNLVRLERLVKRYGDLMALDHMELDIRAGEILGLLGPNGAGKTTLIHALTGLIAVDSGTIELFGHAMRPGKLEPKRHFGLVTQELTLFYDLTARENLAFFGGIYGLKGKALQKRVERTLQLVGLEERADQFPGKFSGGMQRRLNIAAALVHEPRLLIMDEPTVGIDPQSRSYILDTVRELNRQGTTVLYTTHYMEEVQALASRIVIMDDGHAIANGTVDELIARIQLEEKLQMEVSEPTEQLIEQLQAIGGVKQVKQEGRRLLVSIRPGADVLEPLLAAARTYGGGVRYVNADKPTLEDIFLTLTGKQLRDGDGGEAE
ncbi:ABC transporter ATP-binding protein [Paenibacillus sp. IB182496]|uniref:ABC transporter ATP-binding protein n=1 Tax=Paenibacillus sabuli TaxID=2772509 RepID=A0A927BV53_9BACL|nr:ABC transporter ATP-binding protein [Paenibacillus sabuli]MBD2846079.1 ABC transporter ATP-binding protein [Paenibacillus sabuli]